MKRVCFLFFTSLSLIANAQNVIYVSNSGSSGSGSGSSWSSPLDSFTDALATANAGDEIWVKKGDYPFTSTITIDKEVSIYGGFSGDETSVDERANITTLDRTALLSSNGTANVQITSSSAEILLDGIQINGVQSGDEALRIYNTGNNVKLTKCVIGDNNVRGLSIIDASPVVTMCKITENTISSGYGAGVRIIGASNPVFKHSVITYNTNTGDKSAGVYIETDSKIYGPEFYTCNIMENEAGQAAGGIFLKSTGRCVLDKCIVSSNRHRSTTVTGGAVYIDGDPTSGANIDVDLQNGTIITDNWASWPVTPNYLTGITTNNATYDKTSNVKIDELGPDTRFLGKRDIKTEVFDVMFPDMETGLPAAGHMVKVQFSDYTGTGVYHNLYLPEDWQAGQKYPVIMDVPGNPFNHKWADYSTGQPESSPIGFGLSGGKDCILVGLPMIHSANNTHTYWYGDINETADYVKRVAVDLVENYGADHSSFFITGYSRGGFGAALFSKYDEELNDIWSGFLHYDGYEDHLLFTSAFLSNNNVYNYDPGTFEFAATRVRHERIQGRPTFIYNGGYNGTWRFKDHNVEFNYPIDFYNNFNKYRNHSPHWAVCDIPIRQKAREWLYKTIAEKTGTFSISGTVTNVSGDPVPNIRVQTGLTHFVYTDANGNYSIEGLIKGTRDVHVKQYGSEIATQQVVITSSDITNVDFTIPTLGAMAPTADSYVQGGDFSSTNYGTAATLAVEESSNAAFDRMSFLKFDISAIPYNVPEAKIFLKVKTRNPSTVHKLHLVTDDSWTETGITWNNKPGTSSLISTQTVPVVNGWIEFDVTSEVNNESDGTLSVRISDVNADYAEYYSKETGSAPQLIHKPIGTTYTISGYILDAGSAAISGATVNFSNGVSSVTADGSGYYSQTVDSTWSGTATPSKNDYTFSPTSLSFTNVTANQSNQGFTGTFASQSGTISTLADAYVEGGTSTSTNYGTAATLAVEESSNAAFDRMSFLKFDLSPISGTVDTAKVRLKVITVPKVRRNTDALEAMHSIHLVTDDTWTESGITWDNKPGTSILIDTKTVPLVGNWIEFDVTSFVNNETDGEISIRVSDTNAADDYVLYHSREAKNADDRPQLVYTLGSIITSTSENLKESIFLIYPNPASDQINLVGSGLKGARVELTDLSGKSVLRKRLTEDSSSVLQLNAVQKGVYFLRITKQEGEIITRKIIVD